LQVLDEKYSFRTSKSQFGLCRAYRGNSRLRPVRFNLGLSGLI